MDDLPKRETLTPPIEKEDTDTPTLFQYGYFISFAMVLIALAFLISPPDPASLLLNFATEILGAILIFILIDRRVRDNDIKALRGMGDSARLLSGNLFSPRQRRITKYLRSAQTRFTSQSSFYVDRAEFRFKTLLRDESFYLLGGPGAGKTTELQRLFEHIAGKSLSNVRTAKVPLFVTARNYFWNSNSLLDGYFQYQAATYEGTKAFLQPADSQYLFDFDKSRLVLIVDGVDEVSRDNRRIINKMVGAELKAALPSQFILSSQTRAYEPPSLDFPIVTLPDLSDDEILQFFLRSRMYAREKIGISSSIRQ